MYDPMIFTLENRMKLLNLELVEPLRGSESFCGFIILAMLEHLRCSKKPRYIMSPGAISKMLVENIRLRDFKSRSDSTNYSCDDSFS